MGPSYPSPKMGVEPPIFGPCLDVSCGQTAGWMKMPLGMEFGLDPVLDEDPAPPSPKGGRAPTPQFSAHVYYGQMAAWIKMPLGVGVGLDPCHIV